MASRRFPFVWLDVFTKTPLEGNPLAVFADARGLSDDEMQAIARETHLSETTFVFPEEEERDLEQGFRTRIFAVSGEMPFAGHPTLGTANVLAGTRQRNEISLRLPVGRIPVTFSNRDGLSFGEMVQNDPVIGQTHDPESVAKTLKLSRDDLDPTHPIQTVSTGVPFAIVPLRSLDTISRVRPDTAMMEDYLRGTDAKYLYLICRETVDPSAAIHARMIYSGGEDPATGSAAGPAVAWSVQHGVTPPGHPMMIEQGLEVHRPSHIFARASLRDGAPVDVRVGGHCAPAIRGELTL
jgi:trans-2,3-dihydro-3-hydroxyanthranilate isomerase